MNLRKISKEELGERKIHPKLITILEIMPGLYSILGDRYEIVLHDLKFPHRSLIGIVGNITGRKPGAPITNYVIHILRKFGDDASDRINYRSVNYNGHTLRSSTIFIRQDKKIIGCLCINQDMTDFTVGLNLFNDLTEFREENNLKSSEQEQFFLNIDELMKSIVQSVLSENENSIAKMSRDERYAIVRNLEEKGIFSIKGSVEFVANCLNVSTFTIYGYLNDMR